MPVIRKLRALYCRMRKADGPAFLMVFISGTKEQKVTCGDHF
jgi:hypothetical protein